MCDTHSLACRTSLCVDLRAAPRWRCVDPISNDRVARSSRVASSDALQATRTTRTLCSAGRSVVTDTLGDVSTASRNASLSTAKENKEDEFYTQLSDIEREVKHYWKHFEGKTVYLNCDDPRVSNFFYYFSYNFEKLGLKKLIATCYKNQDINLFSANVHEEAVWLEYDGDTNGSGTPDPSEISVKPMKGNGDFRSAEAIELLKQADIVITNPPFSLFREFVNQLLTFDKKFLILGNQNAITYKEVFPHIMSGKLWLGVNDGDMSFQVPDHYTPRETRFWVDEEGKKWRSFGNMAWYTNLDHSKRHEELILYRNYDADRYQSYDNYEGIEVGKVADIPSDYDGVMGVTPGFLTKYNPDQFEIVGLTKTWLGQATKVYPQQTQVGPTGKRSKVTKLNDGAVLKLSKPPVAATYYEVDGDAFKQTYPRILIQRRKSEA